MENSEKVILPDVAKIPETIRKHHEQRLDKVTAAMLKVFYAPLSGISYALEAKDEYSYCHSERVEALVKKFADFLPLSKLDQHLLILTAAVHDIGKIGIPDVVLLKPGKLTDEEYAIMKKHSVIGADIVHKSSQQDNDGEKTSFLIPDLFRVSVSAIEEGIRHHHERWDGRGYPDGLAGENIPEFARIIALCDSTDAMLSNRVYRKALSMETCHEQIVLNSGVMYDPKLTEIYLAHWDEIVPQVYADKAE